MDQAPGRTFKRWIGNPNAILSEFPKAIAVDGPFWSEIEGRAGDGR